ncbi:hypothetical protein [uncultured Jatrophihabitans sp.]|uniref:hypothetical protein n=1 Tax=uncultured Jatrophihabitans sp. TaxID=1610747 RepID=UPI0035CAE228
MSSTEEGLSLFRGLAESGMSYADLALEQMCMGGSADDLEVEAYVLGLLRPNAYQHNLLAQAINEHFIDQGLNHPVAYADDEHPSD